MVPTAPPRWTLIVVYVAFALGAVLAGVSLVQLVSDVELLENPWTGMVGMWLLAFVLYGMAKNPSESR